MFPQKFDTLLIYLETSSLCQRNVLPTLTPGVFGHADVCVCVCVVSLFVCVRAQAETEYQLIACFTEFIIQSEGGILFHLAAWVSFCRLEGVSL